MVEAGDFDEAVAFYRDALGLPERAAFEGDGDGVTTTLVEAGAELVAAPVETPWRSLNSRLDAPAGLHITLFEELESPQERAARPGFGDAAGRDGPA